MPRMIKPLTKALPFVGSQRDEVFDSGFTMEEIETRIEELDDAVWDIETELERKQEKYNRFLDEAETREGYAREKRLGLAHDVRVAMERLESRREDVKDRLEIWRDIRDLVKLVREGGAMESSVDVQIEDVDTETLIKSVKAKRKELEDRRDEHQDLLGELEAAVEWDRKKDRYRREREEAAARSSILDRDAQLREDFEDRVEEPVIEA